MEKKSSNRQKTGRNPPPKETQFIKGKIGNPNGRPKGTRNRSTIVREWLEANYKKVNKTKKQTTKKH